MVENNGISVTLEKIDNRSGKQAEVLFGKPIKLLRNTVQFQNNLEFLATASVFPVFKALYVKKRNFSGRMKYSCRMRYPGKDCAG